MLVIVDFDRRIDTQQHLCTRGLAVGALDHQGDVLLRLDFAFQALDVEGLVAHDAQRLHRVVALELQRQHANADQVRAVDTPVSYTHLTLPTKD